MIYSALSEILAQEESSRLERFREAWKAYYGELPRPLKVRAGVDDNIRINFIRLIVDKGVSFLFGQEVKFELDEVEETQAEEWLDACWRINRKMTLLAVEHAVDELKVQYEGFPRVLSYLDAVQADVIENADGYTINMTLIPEVSEFLGTETGGEELLLAFERCLSVGEGGHFTPTAREALRLIDKQLFRPLWRRRAMSRVELMLMGMGDRDRLVDRLLDRLSKEPGVVSQVRFLRRFGQLFLVVEDACQGIGDPRREVFAREAMGSVWLFSGTGRHSEFAPEAAREAYEAVLEVFRSLRRAEGEVTAAEAEEISVEMKRKYRDNAEVVAILLRWTLDPAREEMLHLLEEHPPLLEAAGRDTDLMRLLDTVVRDERVLGLVRTLALEPETLKMRLREIA